MYDDDVVDGVPVSLFDVIEGDSELAVVYDGNVAIQSDATEKFHTYFLMHKQLTTPADAAPRGGSSVDK